MFGPNERKLLKISVFHPTIESVTFNKIYRDSFRGNKTRITLYKTLCCS